MKLADVVEIRNLWLFTFSKEAIQAAAAAKLELHTERLEYWTKRQKAVKKELETKGVLFGDGEEDEGPDVLGFSSSSTYYSSNAPRRDQTLKVDPKLSKKYNEANAKVEEHTGKVREFKMFVAALVYSPETLELTVRDVEFFGL